MKAENSLVEILNPPLEFELLKKQFMDPDISEDHCYDTFQNAMYLFSKRNRKPDSITLKSEMLDILLLVHKKHEVVYDRVVNDFSSLIVKIIK